MNQIRAGAILNYVIIILNTIVGLAYTPYMLRCLGQNEYGLYSLVASIIAYLTLLDFGFGNAIIRYTAKFRAEKKKKEQWEMFGMFLIVYSFIGIIAFGGGLGLYFNVDALFDRTMTADELSQAQTMMLLLTVNLAFTFPLGIFGSIISAYENFVFQRIVNILRIIISTAVLIAVLALGYKAVALVVVQTTFNLLTLAINYVYCRKRLKIHIIFGKFNWLFIREIGLYSFWIFLNAIVEKIYWGSGQFIIGSLLGTVAVAVFSVSILFEQMFVQFSAAISNVLLPKITYIVSQGNDTKSLSDIFIATGRLQSLVISFIIYGFVIFGNHFIVIWAGPNYQQSYIITIIFFVSLYIPLIQNTGYIILQARNQLKFRSVSYTLLAILCIFLQCILTKAYGVTGCAIAVCICMLIGQGLIMNYYYLVKQDIKIWTFWNNILKQNIPPILFSGITYLILSYINIESYIGLFVSIIIYSSFYFIIQYFFSMNYYERELIIKPFKNFIYRK